MRRAARVDENQDAIVRALRRIGATVTSLHRVGQGVPDLLASYRQRWFLLEVKTEDGELTEDQTKWIGAQRAPVYVVKLPIDAVTVLQWNTK